MAEGRQRSEWEQTSCVLAMLVNTAANRDPKKQRAVEPDRFNPFKSRRASKGQGVPIASLKGAFMQMGMKVRKAEPTSENTKQEGA